MKISVVMPVLINEPWQIPMTHCAIETLLCTTEIPFELVVVETGAGRESRFTGDRAEWWPMVDGFQHIALPRGGGVNADTNIGFDAATGDKIVYTGNDIFTRPGWLEAMLKCFEIKDCGIATLASGDLRHSPQDVISEGVYGPFMMFNKGWRFDAAEFPMSFGDTDLIMRQYNAGFRSYRNWSVVIQHFTHSTVGEGDFKDAEPRFRARHQASPLWIYRAFVQGLVF